VKQGRQGKPLSRTPQGALAIGMGSAFAGGVLGFLREGSRAMVKLWHQGGRVSARTAPASVVATKVPALALANIETHRALLMDCARSLHPASLAPTKTGSLGEAFALGGNRGAAW